MKMKYLVFSLLFAGSMILNSVGFARAGDLKVSGFADIIYTFTDETGDNVTVPTALNAKESQFTAKGEVDFEKEQGDVTFRMDLDFPTNANTAGGDNLEQANFTWAVPFGPGLSLTGGIFNSPIGYEAQDAPDKLNTTNGQLFNLVPSNFAGVMLSGAAGPVGIDFIYANEWRNGTAEENSIAFKASMPLMGDMLGISAAYLTSEDRVIGGVTQVGDENLVDVILDGSLNVAPEMDLSGAIEFLTDENNDALAIWASLQHNSPNFPHALTVRWDQVDCDVPATGTLDGFPQRYCADLTDTGAGLTEINGGGATPATGATPTTLTITGSVDLAENLKTKLEWKSLESDLAGPGSDADKFTLQFVAKF